MRYALLFFLSLAIIPIARGQAFLDNNTVYSNQDPQTETRRSDHFRINFGYYNRDTGTPMTEALAQGNLQMFEQCWNRWVNEMGLRDINESATAPDGKKYRANFNVLMTWNDNGGGGAYSTMDANGFFYAMANTGLCRFDPPSGTTPHEFGHVWQGTAGGFNGTDSSGAWWEGHANWMMLQCLNTYPQALGYLQNGMYHPSHGRDYYDSFMIWETARDDPRYGAAWVNSIWTNATPAQRTSEFIIDRMARLDTSGSADKAGAMKDLWGDMAKKLVTWDYERKSWLSQANRPDDGSDWEFYQRCRTPLVKMPGTPGWFRPARQHTPMQYGFNIIPLQAAPGSTVTCNFQQLADPVRQSDWRACLVAVNTAGDAAYSTLWNQGVQSCTLSADQTKLYLVVIAVPRPMKIAEPVWNAYLTDAGRQFPYRVSFTNATPANISYPVQSRTGMVRHSNGGGWKSTTAIVDATAFIGPDAQVLNNAQVKGNARVEDFAVVRESAQVRDDAVVSGRAVVEGSAQVFGRAKVRDWGRVFGFARVFENGRVIEHANCGDGDSTSYTQVSGNAVIKGTSYVYAGSTLSGSLIMDGDSANGGTASNGVHFGWGWGNDVARFASLDSNNNCYVRHTFEKDHAVFALDELGINHGFLMNGARSGIDSGRGGRVLPLDGISQYVELHNSLNDFKDSTFSVWVKWNGGATGQQVWSMGDGAAKAMTLTANALSTGGLRFTLTQGGTTHVLEGPALPVNLWKHLAVVFSGTVCTLYVDGAAVATQTGMTLFPESVNAPLMENANYLGRGNTGGYFSGALDDFQVHNKALTTAEVNALFTAPAPAAVSLPADITAPSPNAATWLVPPLAVTDDTVTMSATPGTDASGWVEYFFTCTSGSGHDSGWISANKYTDPGLTPGGSASYQVRMRDRNGNVTASSAVATLAPLTSSSAGTATFSNGPVGIASGQITMTAARLSSPSGRVEYKFDRTSPSVASSGWQSSPTWTQTGLTAGASCSYTVTVRDGRGNVSAPSAPASALVRDDAAPRLPITPAHWVMQPYATIDNKVSMTAQTAADPSGVRYFFECVSGGGPNSSWQASPTFTTGALPDGIYVYRYKLRDASTQASESGYSTSYSAKITPTTGYHNVSFAEALAAQDDALVSFPAVVVRVSGDSYTVKDPASGQSLPVKPSTFSAATDASLLFRTVTVKGHRYTFGSEKRITFATVTSTGNAATQSITGRVTDLAGVAIPGATLWFSDSAGASANPVSTAITDASGNFTRSLPSGTWYVSAGATTHNTSAERTVVLGASSSIGNNFQLTANSEIGGQVLRRSDGTPIAGASVWFSRSPGAANAPVFTATTNASGNYTRALQDGIWYVATGASGFLNAPDVTLNIAGSAVSSINFSLKSSARNLPRTADLLFSASVDSLPASGAIASWPGFIPAGQTFTAINSPSVETFNGVRWVSQQYADGDGFRVSTSSTAVAVNGVSALLAVRPIRNALDTSWTSIVDLFYNRIVIGVRNRTGRIDVLRNGALFSSAAAIPDGQATILSLVVQPTGAFKVWANGTLMMDITNTSAMTSLVPNVPGSYANAFNIGRNDPDGWTTFNGLIGDVLVYRVSLTDIERLQGEADLTARFLSTDPVIQATSGTGGVINPSGLVSVPGGGGQTFTIRPLSGFRVSDVSVNGSSQGPLASYTFANVTGNRTISATFVVPTAIENWRAQSFGSFQNLGAGADLADPDGDGLRNLAEYALGTPPNLPTAAPASSLLGGFLSLSFTRSTAANDVVIRVLGASSPSGPWTAIATSTGGGPLVPVSGAEVTETGTGEVRNVIVRDRIATRDPAWPLRFLRVEAVR